MTVGEIYAEALRLMFAVGEDMPDVADLSAWRNDPQYADLLASMPGALMRGLMDVRVKMAVPQGMRAAWAEAEREFPTVTATTPDTEEVELPLYIVVLLPYFVASELYAFEESAQAARYRNRYEAGMESAILLRDGESGPPQARVVSVMGPSDGWEEW